MTCFCQSGALPMSMLPPRKMRGRSGVVAGRSGAVTTVAPPVGAACGVGAVLAASGVAATASASARR